MSKFRGSNRISQSLYSTLNEKYLENIRSFLGLEKLTYFL